MKFFSLVLSLLIFLNMAEGKQTFCSEVTIPLWTLLLSQEDSNELPKRLRSSWDKIPETFNIIGLSTLNMSGSAQFSTSQFKAYVDYLKDFGVSPNQIVVVDLREEPHAFLNGHAIRWYAKGAWWTQGDPISFVLAKEKEHMAALSLGQNVVIKRIAEKEAGCVKRLSAHTYKINSLQTEEQVVTALGAHYVRLPVTDHMRPEDKDVDQFLNLVKNLPPQARIYFHCHGGRGRTSTFMILYDIFRNPKLSLDAIIDRQVQLGSLDLRSLSGPLKARKHPNEKSRIQLIRLFYEYMNAPNGYKATSWTKWMMQRNMKWVDQHDENNAFTGSRLASSIETQS